MNKGVFAIRVFLVVAGLLGSVLIYAGLTSLLQPKFGSDGSLITVIVMIAAGLIVLLFFLLGNHSKHNLAMANAVNQQDVKGELTALTTMVNTQLTTVAEAMKYNAELSERNWNQQRMELQGRAEWLSDQARENRQLLIATTKAMAVMNQMLMPGVRESGLPEPVEPRAETPYDRSRIEVPLAESGPVLQEVSVPGHGKRWLLNNTGDICKKYPEHINVLAERILETCHNQVECSYDSIMDRLGYRGKDSIGRALTLLAELGYCNKNNIQGAKLAWLNPKVPGQDFKLSAKELQAIEGD